MPRQPAPPPAATRDPGDTWHPGSEGSSECIAVLQLLHRYRAGLAAREVAALSGVRHLSIVQDVLTHLQRRGRVQCTGRGTAALWSIAAPIQAHLATLATGAQRA